MKPAEPSGPTEPLQEQTLFSKLANLVLAIIVFFLLGQMLSDLRFTSDQNVLATVRLSVPKDDELQLFFVPVDDKIETEEKSVKVPVTGKFTTQTISFIIPDSVDIKKLRLDLGNNEKQGQIQVEQISLNYNGGTLMLLDKQHTDRFTSNEFLQPLGNSRYRPVTVEERYDPFIYSNDLRTDYAHLLKRENRISYPFLISFILVLSAFVYIVLAKVRLYTMKSFYTLASCMFLVLLLLPSLAACFGIDTGENKQEQRVLAGRPELVFDNVKEYPRLFERYYNDNFAFRERLINLGSRIKYHFFGTSATPQKAAVGKDGWIFLNGKFYWISKDLTRENLYTPRELHASVAEWESRMATLARDSIAYYRAFWPDKHVIYPHLLPYCMTVISKDTLARCDQALNYLRQKNSALKVIDVRKLLDEAKNKEAVYYKYDSHWNARGALIAYNRFISTLSKDFPQLNPVNEEKFVLDTLKNHRGDLAVLLGLNISETVPRYRLKDSAYVRQLDVSGYPPKTFIYQNEKSETDLELLMFRDSFTNELIPFLTYHFRKVTLIWDSPFSYPMVKRVNPHLVVEGFASRYF